MLKALPLLLLVPLGCQQASSSAEGDRHFKVGRYRQALVAYQTSLAQGEEGVVALERRMAEARFRILTDEVRRQLHLGRPLEALELLGIAETIRPGHPDRAQLAIRAKRQHSRALTDVAFHALSADEASQAQELYREALRWDSENEKAQGGFVKAKQRAEFLFAEGEHLFFSGLTELSEEKETLAFTSFANALNYWEADSSAGTQLDALSIVLAERALRQAHVFLDADHLGAAWLAANDAARLAPDWEQAGELEQILAQRLLADSYLQTADIAVRSGSLVRADELMALALEADATIDEKVGGLREHSLRVAHRRDYTLARACELDRQYVRALALYASLMETGSAAQDLEWRMEQGRDFVVEAQVLWDQAQEARAQGDEAQASQLEESARSIVRDIG
ncbi:MAG: hypothetical protein MK213_02305 [Planctomycetes bacterium]|nr:hypothetical protein [Planctomycetota bacterium]